MSGGYAPPDLAADWILIYAVVWGAAQAAADDAGAGTDAAWEPPSAHALRAARREPKPGNDFVKNQKRPVFLRNLP